jgi:Lon protease-like protein
MEMPPEAPVMTLPGVILFPEAPLPLHIFEPRYRRMLAAVLDSHRTFVVAMQKPGCASGTPSAIAGLGLVRVCVKHADGTSHLILQGLSRVELTKIVRQRPYLVSQIRPLRAPARDSVAIDALMAKVRDLVTEQIQLTAPAAFPESSKPKPTGKPTQLPLTISEVMRCLEKLNDPDQIADLVSCALLSHPAQRQIILETVEVEPRLRHLIHFLMGEINQRQKKMMNNE